MIIQNRRRGMGKKPKTVIEQLQDLGCLMWFPLKSTYGKNDALGSGLSCTGSSFSINSNSCIFAYGMFAPGGVSNVNLASSDFDNGDYTLMLAASKYSNSGELYIGARLSSSASSNNGVYIGGPYDATGANNVGSFTAMHMGATVRIKDGNIMRRYSDGNFVDETERTLPDVWNYDYLRFASPVNNSRYSITNLMLFGRALSHTEVAQVYALVG